MSADHAFIGLTHLLDPRRHREYNEWHQLDHLPENLALPGVAWGNRWVRTPACAAASFAPDAQLADAQYAIMYAFRPPHEQALAAWTQLNQRAIWWGRRPELPWTARRPLGFFELIKGYAAPRTLVADSAVPHRPHRGVHVTVGELVDPESADSAALLAHYDRIQVPRMLQLPGVAGVQTHRCVRPAVGLGDTSSSEPTTLMVRLLFLDGDPVEVTGRIEEDEPGWIHGGPGESVRLSSPFESIRPWSWDWFDAAG